MASNAFVTLATNDSYAFGALVLAQSLRAVNTSAQLVVLVTRGVSEPVLTALRQHFNLVQEVSLIDSEDVVRLALINRPELGVTLTKLHCWRLTQFSKCVFLDADTLVLQNVDDLFDRQELSAASDVGWPDCFNSGVFVFVPSEATFKALVELLAQQGSFDGGDQGLLNSYFGSDWVFDISRRLPFVYNVSFSTVYSYLPAFKRYESQIKIIHFLGAVKPWNLNYDTTSQRLLFIPKAFEHVSGYLSRWWDLFAGTVLTTVPKEVVTASSAAGTYAAGQGPNYQSWEQGNIDYLGVDSFKNILAQIETTLKRN